MSAAEHGNRLCRGLSSWKTNASCVGFISVDGFSPNLVRSGRLFSTELYSPYWTGYNYARLAYKVATNQTFKKSTILRSLHVTPENAVCVTHMARDMESRIRTFRFTGTLQRIAGTYRCRVIDADE
jgi:hypothetical protein